MKRLVMAATTAALCLALTVCTPADEAGSAPAEGLSATTGPLQITDMPAFFDCVRTEKGVLIAAHRGGPAPGYPENALETLQNTLSLGVPMMEIDVAESQDGVLYLMHDRSLTRTTALQKAVAEVDWSDVSRLKLSDNNGRVTAYSPPAFSDVLEWAVSSGAIMELDRKPTTSFRNIIAAVREAGAENNVILISYNDNQAEEIARLAPDLMMTAGVNSRDHQTNLEAAGVDMDHVIAWLGTNNPNPRAFQALASRGIESAFGTLGRPGERLDDTYWADGDGSEYADMVRDGLVLLATDEPFRVADALTADDRALEVCGQ